MDRNAEQSEHVRHAPSAVFSLWEVHAEREGVLMTQTRGTFDALYQNITKKKPAKKPKRG